MEEAFLYSVNYPTFAHVMDDQDGSFSFHRFSYSLQKSRAIRSVRAGFVGCLNNFFVLRPLLFIVEQFCMSVQERSDRVFPYVTFRFRGNASFFTNIFNMPFVSSVTRKHGLIITLNAICAVVRHGGIGVVFKGRSLHVRTSLRVVASRAQRVLGSGALSGAYLGVYGRLLGT